MKRQVEPPENVFEVEADILELLRRKVRKCRQCCPPLHKVAVPPLPRREPVDINALIRETVTLTAADAAHEGIAIHVNLQDNLPLVVADRIQLQQVVLNLIVNAFDAMRTVTDAAPALDIETRGGPAGMIEVAISDTGPGLSADTAERVFDAFYTTKVGGMGMGLAISRTIIESLGGQIWASAATPRGTEFRFSLVADEAAPSAQCDGTT